MADAPLEPGSVIGILGGGQLGRMLALSAARLGLKTLIYSNRPDEPAYDVAASYVTGDFEDSNAVGRFASLCDVVTFEFENIPRAALDTAAERCPVHPSPQSLELTQDRLVEKNFLARLGVPVAPYAGVSSNHEIDAALDATGIPALMKTRRMGYDGKGQMKIARADEAHDAFAALGGVPAIVEGFIDFSCEVSVIVTRARDGAMTSYDVTENDHRNHILNTSSVPAKISPGHANAARDIAAQIAEALGHVGVLCVEMFHTPHVPNAPLVVNEIAPRVHNSGHWTIDGCGASQFENHIRAIAGWPLASAERHSDAVMTNLIGADAENWRKLAAEPGAILHLYGKRDAAPGRKMGHVTRLYPRG